MQVKNGIKRSIIRTLLVLLIVRACGRGRLPGVIGLGLYSAPAADAIDAEPQ
jgi:hypothetical protein